MKNESPVSYGDDAWDTRALGADEAHVKEAPDRSVALAAALDLHPVSIRLQKSLIENLKALAHLHGLGYQPLVRQILTRWVDAELRLMVTKRAQEAGFDPCNEASDAPAAEDASEGAQHRAAA
jgi:hypothetical protein